jgi:hypothetical protein
MGRGGEGGRVMQGHIAAPAVAWEAPAARHGLCQGCRHGRPRPLAPAAGEAKKAGLGVPAEQPLTACWRGCRRRRWCRCCRQGPPASPCAWWEGRRVQLRVERLSHSAEINAPAAPVAALAVAGANPPLSFNRGSPRPACSCSEATCPPGPGCAAASPPHLIFFHFSQLISTHLNSSQPSPAPPPLRTRAWARGGPRRTHRWSWSARPGTRRCACG